MDEVLTKYFRSLIYDTISSREVTGTARYDMMQLLIQAKKGTLQDDDLGVTAARSKYLTKYVLINCNLITISCSR